MFDFITRYAITLFSASVTLAAGVILLMLSVPTSREWRKFRVVRLCVAVTCFILSASDFISCFALGKDVDHELFSAMTLIVASYQALVFTVTSLVFVRADRVNARMVLTQLACITVAGAAIIVAHFYFPGIYPYLFGIAFPTYVAQLLIYLNTYRKAYKQCVERLEAYYDDEEAGRVQWINQYFYSALVIGVLAMFFCLVPFSSTTYDLFVCTYTFFYVFIAGCVVNYRVKAGFIVSVPAASPQKEDETETPSSANWAEALHSNLEKWVAEKKFVEMDATPDKVAEDLGTTKCLLNGYFAKYEQVTFREWRTRQRILEAERILSEEEHVILSSLHEQVGVSDKSNFRKHFKQLTGMTPAEYRRQYHH